MAKYSAIKAAVNAYIKQNGRKEITGKILNAVLNATIDSLGKFYQFAGEALPTDDPGTPDQNLTYLAGTAGTYTNFGGLTLDTQEIALLMWDGEWKKQTLLFGIQEVDASVDNQVGTPSVDVDFENNVLTLSFHNIKGDKGDTGDPAGFGQVTASVDDTIGNPSVQVQTSGEDTAKNIAFEFHGLRGETGITSVVVSVDNTTGNPACSVSLVGQVLHLDFTGLKGLKGDTGVSADYPITIYNGLDSDATDQALAAAQGKVLDGKVSQLDAKLIKITGFGTSGAEGGATTDGDIYYNTSTKLLRKRINASTYETIPYYSGAIYTCNGYLYIWNGTDLVSKENEIEPRVDEIDETLGQVISDTMKLVPGVNLYDKSKGLLSGYINEHGGISPASSGYKYSTPTPVTPGHYYYLYGRNITISYAIRCLDANGQPLKVLASATGQQINMDYELPNTDGTGRAVNGQFLVPSGAVSVQFNVTWNNVGDDNSVMLIDLGDEYVENPVIPGYTPYVKPSYEVNGVSELDKEMNGVSVTKLAPVAYDATGKYINGANTNGDILAYEPLALAYYPIKTGITYEIRVPKTTNNAGWELGYSAVADGATRVQVLQDYGKGTWASASYSLVSTFTGFLVVGYATETQLPSVSYQDTEGGIVNRIEAIEDNIGKIVTPAIGNAPAMFFGDSLTAASSVGVIGFAELIANWLKVLYRPFLLDSADGNTADVPADDYVSYTNYAKDGTCNMVVPSRPNPDSVVERVKRHIVSNTNVSLVLIECCVNDVAYPGKKGQISESYTETFDIETTIGAIEETCRYLTTLGKPLKIGFLIPWQITWVNPNFFDDHIQVFKKWGVPYLDLRETAGFNMRDCVAHRIYSLTAESYSSYSNTTTYNTDDIVKYGGFLYKCKTDGVVGIPPTNADYWIKMPGGTYDGTHLNNIGHQIVCGKVRAFLESL